MKVKNISAATFGAALFTLGVCAQLTQAYRFFGKEAEHLWMNDWIWINSHLAKPGGIVQLLTSALTQFYLFPYVGAIVFTIICAIICLCINGRRLRLTMVCGLVPCLFLFLCHESTFYNLKGDMALMLAIGFAAAVPRNDGVSRLLPLAFIPLLYWSIGSAAIIASLLIATGEIFDKRWRTAFIAPAIALATGAALKSMGYYVTWAEAFSPVQYYNWPSTFFFQIYAWVSTLLAYIVLNIKSDSKKLTGGLLFGCFVMAVNTVVMYRAVHNPKSYMMLHEEWLADHEDWKAIIALHEGNPERNCFVSYINLALAKEGLLCQRLYDFSPYVVSLEEALGQERTPFQGDATTGASTLNNKVSAANDSVDIQKFAPLLMKNDELSREGQKVQAVVMYEWGGAALCNAQKAAFEANMLTPGCCDPYELKRLVTTNAVFQSPKVAEKYLRRLQRTTFHKAWADSVLANRKAFDNSVASLRKSLPKDNALYMKTQVVKTLQNITETDPTNAIAAQFYEAYLMLSQDEKGLEKFREKK